MVKYLSVTVESRSAFRSVDDLERYLSESSIEKFFEDRIEGYIRRRGEDRFRTEGDDASGPWAPLSRATLRVKTKEGNWSHGINVRTGELMRWATEGTFQTSRGSSGPTFSYPKRKPQGQLLKKAKGAQYGEDGGPARPVIALGEQDAIQVMSRFADYFDEVLK